MRFTPIARLTLTIAALTGMAFAQTEDPPQAEPQQSQAPLEIPRGVWLPLDRVEIVANTDCLTLRALDRRVNDDDRMTSTDTREAYFALRTEIALENINSLLKRQAGEDLGFDETMVKAHVRNIWDDRVDKDGGVTRATKQLTENSETVIEKRDEIESEIYTRSWTSSQLGHEAGPGGRPVHDRFARPGQVRQHYKRMRLTGLDVFEALGKVGGKPASYELEILLFGADRGGAEQAYNQANTIRTGLDQDSVDWEDALLNFGELNDPRQLVNREKLVLLLDPGNSSVASFADNAEVGAYSQVIPYQPPGSRGQRQLLGFAIYKLIGRTPAVVPGFGQPGVQKHLTRFIQYQQDVQRYESGLKELREKAYVWYPGIEEERAQLEAEYEARKQEALEAREQNEAETQAQEPAEESKPAIEGRVGEDVEVAPEPAAAFLESAAGAQGAGGDR